jgi:hypothetical protein
MLLLNFCIFFIVDNIRKNRSRNRGSIIRKRLNRRRSVSFADPLVKPTVPKRGQSAPSLPEEIEMADLGQNRAQSRRPQPAPVSVSLPKTTIPPQPKRPAPILNLASKATQAHIIPPVSRPKIPPPAPPSLNRNRPSSLRSLATGPTQNVSVTQCNTLPRVPVRRAPPVPSAIAPVANPAPLGLTKSMSVRLPHRD